MKREGTNGGGFTIVELMVGLALIGVLTALVVFTTGYVSSIGKKASEVAAAKSLAAAYLMYPAENNGRLMPGVSDKHPAYDHSGNELPGFLARRWPYRLGPYFDYEYRGVAVVNESKNAYDRQYGQNPWLAEYMASIGPAFGINSTYVGGNYTFHAGEPRLDTESDAYSLASVTRVGQAKNPGRLIVFTSAFTKLREEVDRYGNYYILGPHRWQGNAYDEDAPSSATGNVHFRYNGHAVAIHLDGSVKLLNYEQLRDPTRWSNEAQLTGGPTLTRN